MKKKRITKYISYILLLFFIFFCVFIFRGKHIKKMNISHAHNLIFQKFLQIYVVYGEYINNKSTHIHTQTQHRTIRTKSLLMQSVLIFTKVFIQSSWDFDMSYNTATTLRTTNIHTHTHTHTHTA